jgi:hypothetical protein
MDKGGDRPKKDGDKGDKGKRKDGDKGDNGKGKDKRKGNNGVGNGEDPQPPGEPPVNDGPGTGKGNPGNKGKGKPN